MILSFLNNQDCKKRDSSLCRYRLAKLHKNTEIQKKKTKLNLLRDEDKLENKNKSSKRIPVEYVNVKIKAFKIVATMYRNRRKRFGLRFNLICALVNFDRGLLLNDWLVVQEVY
jgi:hypothetical protein